MNKFFPPPASSWLHLIKRGARMSPLSARDVRYLARSPACKQGLCTHVPLLLHDATPDISHLLLVSPSRCRKTLQFRRLFLFSSFFSLSSSFFFFFVTTSLHFRQATSFRHERRRIGAVSRCLDGRQWRSVWLGFVCSGIWIVLTRNLE